MRNKKVHYYKEDDILYFLVKRGKQYNSEEISPGITLELGKRGELLGIEVLRASKVLKSAGTSLRKTVFASL